jgi:hypothetical protein
MGLFSSSGAPHRPPGTRWFCNTATDEQTGRCSQCYNGTPDGADLCGSCQRRTGQDED